MPITFPRRPFEDEFSEARERVLEYFDFAYVLADRVATRIRQLRQLEEEGKRKPSKGKNVRRVIAEAAQEFDVSTSYCQAAKLCGREFSRRERNSLLRRFEERGLIPTREHFIALAAVPRPDRPYFIDAMLTNGWTAKRIKEERKRQYGVRSNGYQRPRPPRTALEALAHLDLATARLEVVFERLREVQAGVSCGPVGVDFRVPRALMPRVQACRDALAEVRAGILA